MSDDQTARVRTTTVRPGDQRVAGYYEQTAGLPGRSAHDLVTILGSLAGLRVTGSIDGPTLRLSFGELRAMAGGDRMSNFDERRIVMIDLFARIRPLGTAEVVILETPDGDMFAYRIDSLLADPDAHLEVGRPGEDGVPDWRAPLAFHGRSTPRDRPIEVTSMTLTTFQEFLDGTSQAGRS